MSSTVSSTAVDRSQLHQRRTRRRLSIPDPRQPGSQICPPLPHSLEALDLSSASPTQTLASLRFLVLSYLADLERKLCELESPDMDTWKAMGAMTMEEARQWTRTALEMLEGIRADVCSHFPEFHFADLPDVPGLTEMRSHLPDMPDMRSHLSDMRTKLDDVRSRFHDIDFKTPLNYIPTLSDRLRHLHSHLSSMDLPSGLDVPSFTPSSVISDLLDAFLSSDALAELSSSTLDVPREVEDLLERAAREIAYAVQRSLDGVRLITYSDLPFDWKNNPFVTRGYRLVTVVPTPTLVSYSRLPDLYQESDGP